MAFRLTVLVSGVLGIGLATRPIPVRGQDPADAALPTIPALRLAEGQSIRLDGRIDDAAWANAVAITDFKQQNPDEGSPASRDTEVRIAYDDDNLYIAVIAYDDPDLIIAHQRQRDAFLFTDDRFAWVLDTFRDGRTGYAFEVNPAGAISDGLITGGGGGFGGGGRGGVNRSWDGIWDARTERRPDGWSVEIRIPFRTVNFDPNADSWGINFQRSIRRHNETALWSGFRRTEGLYRLINAGTVTGLTGMSQGIGLEARAYGIASWENTPSNEDPTEFPTDIGLDVNYSVTPSLRASISLNTDFAEVETDQRRVNLTRFPLRFPEQRDFFLEGSGVFTFAPRSGPQPFFSRRIGLNGGEPIPINVGGRLTGQVGSTEIGFYQIRTGSHTLADDSTLIEPEDFTVARIRQQIFDQSSIGVIYTRRATSSDTTGFSPIDRHTVGVDMNLVTNRFLGDNNLEFEAFYVYNSNEDPEENRSWGDLTSRGFRVNFPNDIWTGHVSYREFGEYYDPAVGFVTRDDFRRLEPRVGWAPRPAGIEWIRQFDWSVQYRSIWELGTGILEERQWQFKLLGIEFESADNLDVEGTNIFEFLDKAFEISDGIFVQPGDYSNWRYELRARTASQRFASFRGGVNLGGFWDGTRTEYTADITFRLAPGVRVAPEFEYNDVSLSGGDFDTSLYRFETSIDPSPWVGFTGQVQYDDVSGVVGLYARLRWIIDPGNDLFLVYTHNWQDLGAGVLDDVRFTTLSQGASVKLNYTYRF